MNVCFENLVEKINYLLKHIYMIRLFCNSGVRSACCGRCSTVIKSFWLLLSLDMRYNKTNQEISNYDRLPLLISSVSTCAGFTGCGMNWKVVPKSQDYSHPLSLFCFMSSVRRSFDLESILIPESIALNIAFGILWLNLSPVACLVCAFGISKIC